MAKEFVEKEIRENKVVIFSKSYCPYCKMAKKCFDALNQTYKAIELDKRKDGDDIQDALNTITGSRTVPKVFVNGECLGGGTDVKTLHENGELAKILAKQGA